MRGCAEGEVPAFCVFDFDFAQRLFSGIGHSTHEPGWFQCGLVRASTRAWPRHVRPSAVRIYATDIRCARYHAPIDIHSHARTRSHRVKHGRGRAHWAAWSSVAVAIMRQPPRPGPGRRAVCRALEAGRGSPSLRLSGPPQRSWWCPNFSTWCSVPCRRGYVSWRGPASVQMAVDDDS